MQINRGRRCAIARAAALVVGAGLSHWTHGANFTASWIANGVGSWTTAARWSTNPTAPNNTASNFYDALVDTAGAKVTLNSAISISRFTLSDGTLLGGSTLTTGTLTNWLGGNIAGTGTLNVRNTLNIGSTDHGFSGFTVNIGSLAITNWTGGEIHAVDAEGGTFNNAGTFNDSTGSSWSWSVVKTPVFNNLAGARFVKTGASGTFQEIQAAFNNSGTIDIQSSGLFLDGGGTSSGTILVAANANLAVSDFNESLGVTGAPITTWTATSVLKSFGGVTFFRFSTDDPGYDQSVTNISGKYDSAYTVVDSGADGQVNFLPGAHVSTANDLGPSDWYLYSGKLQFDTGQAPNIAMRRLTVDGGEIAGSDTRQVFGTFSWSSGTISGNGLSATYLEGTATLDGTDKYLTDHFLFNQNIGTLNWSGGDIHLHNASISNDASSTWNNSFDGSVINDYLVAQSSFYNSGTFLKSSGTGVSSFDSVEFNNSGTVIVQSGTLRLGGGGQQTGTFNIGSTSILELASISGGGSSSHTLDTTSFISGPAGSRLRFIDTTIYSSGSINVDGLEVIDSNYFVSNLNKTVYAGIAPSFGDYGIVTVESGGTWTNSNYIQIGVAGSGTLDVHGGGVVNVDVLDLAVFGSLSSGYVSVSDASSKIVGTGFLRVANFGSAQLDISAGGAVSNTNGIVGSEIGAFGTVTVSGSGSKWTNSDYLTIGSAGRGSMSITNGGSVSSTIGYIGLLSTGVGSVLVSGAGSHWTMGSFLSVGTTHDGTLIVQNGGVVDNVNASVGDAVGGHGYVRVSGSGSQWNSSGFTSIGNNGNGTLIIDIGAHVSTTALAQIGSGTATVGIATITGSGSRWDTQQQIGIGVNGTGTLVIANGGVLTTRKGTSATASSGIIGRFGIGSGTVLVTGSGSRWDMTGTGDDGSLNVGFGSVLVSDVGPGGKGFLSINDGAVVTAVNSYIGRAAGALGTVTVGGAGAAATFNMTGSLFIGGDNTAAAVSGAGTLIVGTLGTVNAPTSTRIWNNGTVLYHHGTFSTGTLALTGGGKILLSPSNDKVLQTTSISIDSPAGSKIDLSNNKAIVDYTGTSPADAIRQQIQSAYTAGAWTGNGLTTSAGDSTHGLGYADNSVLGLATFGGIPVDATSVLIKFTYLGDSNLDGVVNIKDLAAMAANYNTTGGKFWTNGDFNYDGNVNVKDLTLLATNWQAGAGAPLGSGELAAVLSQLGLPTASVPEPGVMTIGLVLGTLLRRTRRR